jgi:ABC-type phosphate/phosphonate transport system substrate-binding protein
VPPLPLLPPNALPVAGPWLKFAFILTVFLLPHSGLQAQEQGITPMQSWFRFAATPFLTPKNMAVSMAGIKESMEFVLKTRVRFATSFDTDGFRRRLERSDDDFVFIFPSEYALAIEHGYLPVAQLETPLKAFIVVPVASPIRTPGDLRSKLLMVPGFGSPIAELARQAAKKAGLRWDHDVFGEPVRTDGICLREMIRGLADACAAFQAPTKIIQRKMGIKLRSIIESDGLPPPLFAAHKRVPIEDREKVRKALISLGNTDSGRFRLRSAGLSRIVAFQRDDYPTPPLSSDKHP